MYDRLCHRGEEIPALAGRQLPNLQSHPTEFLKCASVTLEGGSAPRPALRDGVPHTYGRVAARWDTLHRTPESPGVLVPHGPEQGHSGEACFLIVQSITTGRSMLSYFGMLCLQTLMARIARAGTTPKPSDILCCGQPFGNGDFPHHIVGILVLNKDDGIAFPDGSKRI